MYKTQFTREELSDIFIEAANIVMDDDFVAYCCTSIESACRIDYVNHLDIESACRTIFADYLAPELPYAFWRKLSICNIGFNAGMHGGKRVPVPNGVLLYC